jgi:ubiquinone/menaquinone biosynthesis C-methylase UbiE
MRLLGNYQQPLQKNLQGGGELRDSRVERLPEELFKGKDVLDVGCGEGKVAIEIAMRYFPRKMVALDIDANLLESATRLVDKLVKRNDLYSSRQ